MSELIRRLMQQYAVVLWDFDGVIKDSVDIKTEAFGALFEPFGAEFVQRVRSHHLHNSGVSRFQKIPVYLQWAGCTVSASEVERYCQAFSRRVLQAVIDSAWVPGVREYLQENHTRQRFAIVTATPQTDIEHILCALEISSWFCDVHGAPMDKAEAIESVLERWRCVPESALMIGDAEADFQVACATKVQFLLRRTPHNHELQRRYSGLQCDDFCHG